MAGRNPKSIDLGLMQAMFLPIYHITWEPFFVRGAKKEQRDESGKLLFSHRWTQMSSSDYSYMNNGKIISIPSFVLEEDLKTTIENLENNGCKNLHITQITLELPKYCPDCEHEGTVICTFDTKIHSNHHFVRIYYHHSKPKKDRHYVGTYYVSNGGIKPSEGIDIHKFFIKYWVKSKFNGFAELPIPKARKRETTHQILKRLKIR